MSDSSHQTIKQRIVRILRWSERFTKTDMVYLTKSGTILGSGEVTASLLAILLSITFANLLPKETYGNYKYVMTIAGLLALSTLPGMTTAITRSYARGIRARLSFFARKKIIWGLIGSVACAILGLIYLQINTPIGIALFAITPFIPFRDSFTVFQGYLQGEKQFLESTKYFTLIRALSTIALILAVLITSNFIVLLLINFSFTILPQYYFYKKTVEKHSLNKMTIVDRETVSYGKQLSIMKSLGIASASVSPILLFHLLGSIELAIFSFAIAPVEIIRSFMKSGEKLLLPKLSPDSWTISGTRVFLKKLVPFLVIVAAVIITYIIAAPVLYAILFPKYLESITYSQIFSISLLFTFLTIVLISILKAKRLIGKLYIINFTDIILNGIVIIPFIYYFGILGIIISRLVIKCIEVIVLLFLLRTKTQSSA